MTEKEFRKIVFDLELTNENKEMINNIKERISKNVEDISNNNKIIGILKGGKLASGILSNNNRNIDFILLVETYSKKEELLINHLIRNEVINCIAYKSDSIKKYSDIVFDEKENMISFKMDDYLINLLIRYQNLELFNIEYEYSHNLFIEEYNKSFTYYRNTLQIIDDTISKNNIQLGNFYIIEILLAYSLNMMFSVNRYENYLYVFSKGIEDLLTGKKIDINKSILDSTKGIKNEYTVIDPIKGINLFSNVSIQTLNELRRLKKEINKMIDATIDQIIKEVVIDINPLLSLDEYKWSFKILNTKTKASGGNYKEEELSSAYLRALQKALKSVVDNGLNKQAIIILSNKKDVLVKSDGYNQEDNGRVNSINKFINDNKIKLTFK